MGIFSSIKKAIFGGKAKSTSATSAESTTSPYAAVIPAINDYISQIQGTYANTPQISQYEQQGYDALKGVASDTSGVDAAVAANTKTINGDYLTPDTNPYLADIAKRVGAGALQTINTTFGGGGRTGSGLHATYAGEGVGNALTDLYGSVYESERSRQDGAIARAGTVDASRYTAPNALIEAGKGISARPFDIANSYGGILSSLAGLGGTTSGTTTGKTTGVSQNKGVFGSIQNQLFPGSV